VAERHSDQEGPYRGDPAGSGDSFQNVPLDVSDPAADEGSVFVDPRDGLTDADPDDGPWYDPPDRPGKEMFVGTTANELRDGESLDQHLAEEVPDPALEEISRDERSELDELYDDDADATLEGTGERGELDDEARETYPADPHDWGEAPPEFSEEFRRRERERRMRHADGAAAESSAMHITDALD
jgi:hypothetical protein